MRRRSLGLTIAAVAAVAGLAAPQLASSAPKQDPRAQREQVRAERAAVASKIDVTKASLSEVDDALQALEENVATQRRALADAEAEVATAEQDIADAEAAITKLSKKLKALKAVMRERAVRAYVTPPGDNVLSVLETKDFTSAAERSFYVGLSSQDDADVADQLDGAGTDLAFQKRKANAAKQRAETKRAEQQRRTKAVEAAEAKQQAVADRLQASIDSEVARSLQLAKTDRALSAQIAKEQAELLARLASQKAANDKAASEKAKADAAAVRNAQATNVTAAGRESAPSGGGGGGGGGATVQPGPIDSGVQLAYVQGIPVNAQVANQVTAMINAAAADGVNLRIGNSYRPVSQQIELRKQNCGTSYYAIYEMSSGSCSPPTAKPGQSQHQLGLAIDFASCNRSSACFSWLRGNASRFGYFNLPSESWHWSTTGS